MNRSESIANLAAALAKAQADFPAIPRNKTVKVTSKRTGGTYTFSYAPFEDILRQARPVMVKHGLAFSQGMSSEKALETVVLHSSGEWISHYTPVVIDEAGAQAVGSAITYAKRYGFCSAFGIQADDDDDGNAADGNHVEAAKPVSSISGAGVKRDAFDALPDEQKLFVTRLATAVQSMVREDNTRAAAERIDREIPQEGPNRLEDATELKVALWGLLDSKTRSALTKHRESLKQPKAA